MFIYRRMTPADIPAAAALETAIYDGWSAATIAETLACAANHCFVAVDDAAGTVCGFCACTLVLDMCNLDTLSVAESHRRCGIARELLRFAMHALHTAGATHMWLELRSQNAPALGLYAALHFTQNGLRRGFYQNPPDDAVMMQAELGTR